LGVSIHRKTVCAVLLNRGRVSWHHDIDRGPSESAKDSLTRLLGAMPRRRFPRLRATVSIGVANCQVKAITDLPPLKDVRVLSRLVRENEGSFFLRTSSRFYVTDALRRRDGSLWAAALDAMTVDSALEALAELGIRRCRVIPQHSAVAITVPAGTITVSDDEACVELVIAARGEITGARRTMMREKPMPTELSVPDALSGLGVEASRFLEAYGAATSRAATEFSWAPAPHASRTGSILRVAVAAIVFTLLTLVAAFAPGIRARSEIDRYEMQLERMRPVQATSAKLEGDLRQVSAQLARIDRFRSQRGSITVLIGAISQALPESTALVSLRVDTIGGTLTAVAPRATDVLPQLAEIASIESSRLAGVVTRELMGGARVERATIHFVRRKSPTKSLARAPGQAGGTR